MRLSKRGRYGLLAMIALARRPDALTTSEVIAEEEDVSKKYLDEILGGLRAAGLLKAHRGPGGGYSLARPAARITAADVVEALEGEIAVVPCVGDGDACKRADRCPARGVWQATSKAIRRELGAQTLARLVGGTACQRGPAAGG